VNSGTTPVSDADLARQARTGSLAAFEGLVSRYEHRVYGFALQHFQNPLDAREITQDTFLKAFQSLHQFDPNREFGPWLFTIARNKCIDRHRLARPWSEELAPEESTDWLTPAEAISREEERQSLWKIARECLSQIQFEALWLRYAEEMGVDEIAQTLRKTKTHVKVLLFRARRTLSVRLRHGGEFVGQRPTHLPGTEPRAAVLPARIDIVLPGQSKPV
jgi:RNA polymerase sigma-70 factor (ECF subfamily)